LDFLDACRKFIAIDSTPANGNKELALFAAQLCREAGLHVEIQSEALNGLEQANIIARPNKDRPNEEVMFQTHLDTTDPGSFALWTKTSANPFNSSIYKSNDGDELYGLGSADVKLDFLCKLRAISEVKKGSWKLPPVLVGTFGEENGMAGSVKLVRKKLVSASKALIGEPTELRLIHAMKGFASVEIEIPFSEEELEFHLRHDQGESTSTQSKFFTGKAAHSSDPQSGESAIQKMLDYLEKLPDGLAIMEIEGGVNFNTVPAHAILEIDMVGGLRDTIGRKIRILMDAIKKVEAQFAKYNDPSFTPAGPTLNIGIIRTFEDHIKMVGCCRLPPSVTDDVYHGWMESLRHSCSQLGATFRIADYKQPFRTSLSSDFVKHCQAELKNLGLQSSVATQSSTNEANVFSRFGLECLVFGAGRGVGNSHAPNEFVKISDLEAATKFYRGVLERVCL
jgi:acetylornithine deacetylase/succinyl-diaminopimelate desuccinylase-like protein